MFGYKVGKDVSRVIVLLTTPKMKEIFELVDVVVVRAAPAKMLILELSIYIRVDGNITR